MSALCDKDWERELARWSKVLALEDEERIRDEPIELPQRQEEVIPEEIAPVILKPAALEGKKRAPRALAR